MPYDQKRLQRLLEAEFALCSLATKCQCSQGPALVRRMEWVSDLSPVSWCLLPFVSVPIKTRCSGARCWYAHKLHNSEPQITPIKKRFNEGHPFVQVDAFIINGHYWHGDELCVLSVALNTRRVTNRVVGCKMASAQEQEVWVSKWERKLSVMQVGYV